MVDRGANPFVIDANGKTNCDRFDIFILKNVPSTKSVFFQIKKFSTCNMDDPWCYTTGVYDGKYGAIIGRGGEGTVIQGEWNGKPAAYKFVEMKGLKSAGYEIALNDMKQRLKEMTEMMSTPGDSILPFRGHFRLVTILKNR